MEPGIPIANDETVAELMRSASRELVVLAPALTEALARVVADRWQALGAAAVQVIVDSDPEVYRLGFGDEKGLSILEAAASTVGAILRKQPRTRIAVIVSDGRTLIYTPTPRLIEAGPNTTGCANAVLLGAPPAAVAADLGQNGEPPKVGRAPLDRAQSDHIKESLKDNPPQKFDIARRVRVFNAYFEFVELNLIGARIETMTIQIPNHIIGVLDGETRQQLQTHFQIVPPGDALSSEHLRRARKLIERGFLTVIPNYGVVVKRSAKSKLESCVADLRSAVDEFGRKLRDELQASIDRQRATLVEAFFPRLCERPPEEWTLLGRPPEPENIRTMLEQELRRAFGTADRLIKKMEVKLLFKGVTYEMLTDPKFLEACAKAGLDLQNLHDEFDAAKAVPAAQANAV